MGFLAGLKAFTAAVVGGIGSIPGAMLGGLLIGLAESFAQRLRRRPVVGHLRLRDPDRVHALPAERAARHAGASRRSERRTDPTPPDPAAAGDEPADRRRRVGRESRRSAASSAAGCSAVPERWADRPPRGQAARLRRSRLRRSRSGSSEGNLFSVRPVTRSSTSLLALGLNVIVGFAGLLDLGYVAFFGIGAYTYALLSSDHYGIHWPAEFSHPARDRRARRSSASCSVSPRGGCSGTTSRSSRSSSARPSSSSRTCEPDDLRRTG